MRESDPRLKFWRLVLYHLTNRPGRRQYIPAAQNKKVIRGESLFCFLVERLCSAPLAVLLQLELALDRPLVLPRVVVRALALRARQLHEIFLRCHTAVLTSNEPW